MSAISEFDEEFGKYFLLMEDILLSLNQSGVVAAHPEIHTFIRRYHEEIIKPFTSRIDSILLIEDVLGLTRLLVLLIREPNRDLNICLCSFLRQSIEQKLS
jgi:hypothetical protein